MLGIHINKIRMETKTNKKVSPYEKCRFHVPYSVIGVNNSNIQIPLLQMQTSTSDGDQHSDPVTPTYDATTQPAEQADSIRLTQSQSLTEIAKDLTDLTSVNPKAITKLRRHSIPGFLVKPSFAKQTNLDHLLELIGSFGFYQKMQFFLVGIMAILPSMVAYSYVFVSATPKFTCKTALEVSQFHVSSLGSQKNIEDERIMNLNFNLKSSQFSIENRRLIQLLSDINITNRNVNYDNRCSFSQKEIKQISQSNKLLLDKNLNLTFLRSTLECIEYYYDDSVYGRTLVSDLDLVCLKSHMKAATQNTFILGTGCSVFTGILSDSFGRRRALVLMITLMFLVLNITQILMHSGALSINQKFTLFTISRFLQGVAQTMYTICFVLLLEITGPKHRVTAGNILGKVYFY